LDNGRLGSTIESRVRPLCQAAAFCRGALFHSQLYARAPRAALPVRLRWLLPFDLLPKQLRICARSLRFTPPPRTPPPSRDVVLSDGFKRWTYSPKILVLTKLMPLVSIPLDNK
jgi:hypothetical protein